MNSRWFWVLVAGVIGGFAFAAGSSLESRAEDKLRGIGLPTAGTGGPGSRTQNTPGVY